MYDSNIARVFQGLQRLVAWAWDGASASRGVSKVEQSWYERGTQQTKSWSTVVHGEDSEHELLEGLCGKLDRVSDTRTSSSAGVATSGNGSDSYTFTGG